MERPIFTENEIELMDYLNVIWKRKWLIIIPTFIFVFIIGIRSFFLPQQWKVTAIIQPGKYIIQTEGGNYREVLVASSH